MSAISRAPLPNSARSSALRRHTRPPAFYNRGFARTEIALAAEGASKGDLDLAIADYTEAIRLKPDYATAYANRGTCYQFKYDLDRAIADFTEALRLNPTDTFALGNRAAVLSTVKQYDRALADYDEAIGLEPDYAGHYEGRGLTYKRMGQDDLAKADYAKSEQLQG
jgi:tetratricopeptide (TPR) repeat protein